MFVISAVPGMQEEYSVSVVCARSLSYITSHVFCILFGADLYKRKYDVYEAHKVIIVRQTPVNTTGELEHHLNAPSTSLPPS